MVCNVVNNFFNFYGGDVPNTKQSILVNHEPLDKFKKTFARKLNPKLVKKLDDSWHLEIDSIQQLDLMLKDPFERSRVKV